MIMSTSGPWACLIGAWCLMASACSPAQQAASPTTKKSEVVSAQIIGEPIEHARYGDLFMTTWGADTVYMSWGDGTASDGLPSCGDLTGCDVPKPCPESAPGCYCNTFSCDGSCVPRKLMTDAGLMALKGAPPTFAPCDDPASCLVSVHVPSQPEGWACDPTSRDDKPSSLLALDGMVVWAGHVWTHETIAIQGQNKQAARTSYGYLAYSTDHGGSWTEVKDSPWQGGCEIASVIVSFARVMLSRSGCRFA